MADIFRKVYKVLSEAEQAAMDEIKDLAQALHDAYDRLLPGRDLSIAKTALEDSAMRAVRHITEPGKMNVKDPTASEQVAPSAPTPAPVAPIAQEDGA